MKELIIYVVSILILLFGGATIAKAADKVIYTASPGKLAYHCQYVGNDLHGCATYDARSDACTIYINTRKNDQAGTLLHEKKHCRLWREGKMGRHHTQNNVWLYD